MEKRKETSEMYVSLIERKGIKKGVEQGIQQGKIEIIREMLDAGESEDRILRYARITPEQLERIRRGEQPTLH